MEQKNQRSEIAFLQEKSHLMNDLSRAEELNREVHSNLGETVQKLNFEIAKNSIYEQEMATIRINCKKLKGELTSSQIELLDLHQKYNTLKGSSEAAKIQIRILTVAKTRCIEEERRRQALEVDVALKETQLNELHIQLAEAREEIYNLKVMNNDNCLKRLRSDSKILGE